MSNSQEPHKSGSELFIVDNSDDAWKVLSYLHEWCHLSENIYIATGYFEIGSWIGLNDEWQKEVWNFHTGCYQVCEKWPKDRQAKGGKNPRPGRVLTP